MNETIDEIVQAAITETGGIEDNIKAVVAKVMTVLLGESLVLTTGTRQPSSSDATILPPLASLPKPKERSSGWSRL